jgi:protein-disulfide isomerase
MIRRVLLAAALLAATTMMALAQFGASEFPIKDADGDPMANHRVDPQAAAMLTRLPGTVTTGDPKGDVTLVQFYDLNCPFCREAARDLDTLLREDAKLKIVFVPYPVLSVASAQAGKVEIAVAGLVTPERYLEFRRRVYAGRGVVDGERALAVAGDLGLDRQKLIDIANEDDTTDKLKTHARLADAMKLIATPSYVIGGVAILGHPGLAPLQRVIASVRRCGKVAC